MKSFFKWMLERRALWVGLYNLLLITPKGQCRRCLWERYLKFGLLHRAPDEWYWKMCTLYYADEPYGLPGKGGGINSLIRWQQMYWKSPLMVLCADKVAVREYVRKRVGARYLVPMLPYEHTGWSNVDDIDFADIPNGVVLKMNNGSEMNLFIKSWQSVDINSVKDKLRIWLSIKNYGNLGREWHYNEIQNRVYCEKLLDGGDGQPPQDYKFMCSNGKILYMWIDSDRFIKHLRNFFDVDFRPLDVYGGFDQSTRQFEKPLNWGEMLNVASRLSEGIPIVRIDLYNINGAIYFGEMTFTPCSGKEIIRPLSFSREMASKVDLSQFV